MKRRGLLTAIVIVGGFALFVVDWGGDDCRGAPCEEGFTWKIWVAAGIVVLWLLAAIWLVVGVIRAQVRARQEPRRDA